MSILIHVGPPKSGTSAIQRWLSFHASELTQFGVYYPQHESDPNGISSGNLLSLFCRNDTKELIFSEEKKIKLLADFEKSKASVLLLSSEFFFQKIDLLAEQFPTAKFIAYLRFPLEVIESSYNQGVKRHGEVKRLGVPKTPKPFQLNILERHLIKVGKQRFTLRPYEKHCFVGNSIVNDFKDVLGIPLECFPKYSGDEIVNNSYSIDALEFKRWFNQFPLGELQPILDRSLQAYSVDKSSYSLIGAKIFRSYKEEFINVLERFCSTYNVHNSETYLKHCNVLKQKPIQKQQLGDGEFEALLHHLLTVGGLSKSALYAKLINDWCKVKNISHPERIKLINKHISTATKYKVKQRHYIDKITGFFI